MDQFERMDKGQQEEMDRYKRPLMVFFYSPYFFRYKRPLMVLEDGDTKSKSIP